MSYVVVLDEEIAAPVFRHLAPAVKRQVKQGLRILREDPFETNQQVDIIRLETRADQVPVYRLRVGDWRLVYTRDEGIVKVMRIIHREEGYDWLDERS